MLAGEIPHSYLKLFTGIDLSSQIHEELLGGRKVKGIIIMN